MKSPFPDEVRDPGEVNPPEVVEDGDKLEYCPIREEAGLIEGSDELINPEWAEMDPGAAASDWWEAVSWDEALISADGPLINCIIYVCEQKGFSLPVLESTLLFCTTRAVPSACLFVDVLLSRLRAVKSTCAGPQDNKVRMRKTNSAKSKVSFPGKQMVPAKLERGDFNSGESRERFDFTQEAAARF